jgi:membrane protein implicated in regulation of membrane protease activity
VDPWVLWLIASGLFVAGELAGGDLFLLMLGGGALGGMTVALLGGPVLLQLVGFIVVSALLLALVRPVAKRHLVDRTPEQLDGSETFPVGATVRILQVDGATAVVGDALELE